MVANNIVHANTNREGDALLDRLAVNLLVVKFGGGGINYRGSELT